MPTSPRRLYPCCDVYYCCSYCCLHDATLLLPLAPPISLAAAPARPTLGLPHEQAEKVHCRQPHCNRRVPLGEKPAGMSFATTSAPTACCKRREPSIRLRIAKVQRLGCSCSHLPHRPHLCGNATVCRLSPNHSWCALQTSKELLGAQGSSLRGLWS